MVKISGILNVALNIAETGCKKKLCSRSPMVFCSANGISDVIAIKNKSALSEFKNYLEGFKIEGESFVPKSENPNSSFMEYFNYRRSICVARPAKKLAGISIPARPALPKIVRKSESPDDYILSLIDFLRFLQKESQMVTKEEYYQIIDEISRLMPAYVKKTYPGLRQELVENSGKIFKWRSLMDIEYKENGLLKKKKFYDEEKKLEAVKEFQAFVEKLTGKKVLIPAPSRITIAADELGLLNDPESYKNIDYILFGHGTGSSLITDTALQGTWRFSDTGKSIWEYIEENVPRGKRVLVGCCEQDKFCRPDGIIPKARRELPEMYDKQGQYMYGIGNTVCASYSQTQPAKICESGIRHIIGHSYLESCHSIDSFIDGCYGRVKNVYYKL